MEYQQKLLIITALLIVGALYLAFTSEPAEVPKPSTEATDLLLKSASFGKGLDNYVYSYSETSDGYKTTYTATESGGSRKLDIQNPLSLKKMYITPNDTIFCITYQANETCESVAGNSEMKNYVDFTLTKFFDDALIDRAKGNLQFLLGSGYLKVDPVVEEKTVGSKPCLKVNYLIDYSNLTLADAARFNIGSDSPKKFYLSSCIDNQTGAPHESTLNYSDNKGIEHFRLTRILTYTAGSAPPIVLPLNTSGNAVAVLRKEREHQLRLATCHTDKSGEEKEKCIADMALDLRRKDICDLAGARRDRCLVSIVPLTKDQTICPTINDPSYRDDCYIELAGAYKDASYCSSIKDSAKVITCQSVAKPSEPEPPANTTNGNATNSSIDINDFMDWIDKQGPPANNTNATNGSG